MDECAQEASKGGRIPEKFFLIWKCAPEETEPANPFGGLGPGSPDPDPDDPAGVYRLEAQPPQPYFHRN